MDLTNVSIVPDSKETNNIVPINELNCNIDNTEEEPVLCNIFSQPNYNSSPVSLSDQNDSGGMVYDLFSTLCGTENLEKAVFEEKDNKFNRLTVVTNEVDNFYGLDIDAITDGAGLCSHDAWVPSMSISIILKNIKNNKFEKHILDKELLTTPVVSIKNNMVDSIMKLVSLKLGQSEAMQRNIMIADDVTQDLYGLKELISREYYKSAVDLTGRLLSSQEKEFGVDECFMHSEHTTNSIQLWFTRFCLLAKLQEWTLLDKEAAVWENCDSPDLYYQFYPELYGGREGSMVPFQMRLLLAIVPSYCNRYIESLNRLLYILGVIKNILLNFEVKQKMPNSNGCLDCVKVWKARENRTIVSLVNVAVKMKDFSLAVEIVNSLITNERGSITNRMLYSTLGRIYLQLGDITASKKCFDEARSCIEIVGSLGHDAHDFQDFVDRGLLALAQNNFEEAYRHFEMASYIDPSDMMVMNNCAVCLMYMGHVKEAVRLLSGVINNNPVKALHENVVLNLCTLYELQSTHPTDEKLKLLKIISMHKSDLIQASSLKIPV